MQIKRYEPKWRDDFVRLNRDWIEHYFRLEEADPFGGAVEAEILFKIRHTESPRRGRLTRLDATTWRIDAAEAVQGVAPGQFGVVYTPDGQICAGCGEIAERIV